jgi:hypothetical protein
MYRTKCSVKLNASGSITTPPPIVRCYRINKVFAHEIKMSAKSMNEFFLNSILFILEHIRFCGHGLRAGLLHHHAHHRSPLAPGIKANPTR